MRIEDQVVLPAARSIKDFEELLKSPAEYIVLLDVHIGQLIQLTKLARTSGKQLLIHADLVHGLKHDEAGTQFLCQYIRPAGVISTHASVISIARKHKVTSIQRVFLLDSHSFDTSLRVMKNCDPDYMEVLPGVVPKLIRDVADTSGRPIIAGGFIRTPEEVEEALAAGASAVSSSAKDIMNRYLNRVR